MNILTQAPSDKQIEFAEAIADRLDLQLPDDFTKKAYSEFISENKDDFYFYQSKSDVIR